MKITTPATDLAARAAAIAESGRKRMETQYIAREWWRVNGREVFFCPPQTQEQVRTFWYPGAGVTGI